MTELIKLTKEMIARLRTALDAYIGAELGDLNATADELRAAARQCGWMYRPDNPVREWAEKTLKRFGETL